MSRRRERPKSILLSKRANVFYLEHVRVLKRDDRVLFVTDVGEASSELYNLPERNTAFILLGKGSSITDAAIRRLSESNVVVGFCGSGGTPLFAATDMTFLLPQSEYRPTEYMQKWAKFWFQEEARLSMAKFLLTSRRDLTVRLWKKLSFLSSRKIELTPSSDFERELNSKSSFNEILSLEARWAKGLYKSLARGYELPLFRRLPGGEGQSEEERNINALIDHGNYLCYGFASVVLHGLGISFAFPLLHGKTRRGGLVFDIADLVKDSLVLPIAFEFGYQGSNNLDFRSELIELAQDFKILDLMFNFVQAVIKNSEKYQEVGQSG